MKKHLTKREKKIIEETEINTKKSTAYLIYCMLSNCAYYDEHQQMVDVVKKFCESLGVEIK